MAFKVKSQIRILGIDDAPFDRNIDREVLVIGTVFRAGEYLDGVLSTKIEVDGIDATQKLIHLIKESRTKGQLRCIMLDGICLGGFNVINIETLSRETNLPVIVYIKDLPDFEAIKSALTHLEDGEARLKLMEKAGRIYECEIGNKDLHTKGKVYFQIVGISEADAKKILKLTTVHGFVPEPLRVAHLIAQGIKFGESKGRA